MKSSIIATNHIYNNKYIISNIKFKGFFLKIKVILSIIILGEINYENNLTTIIKKNERN